MRSTVQSLCAMVAGMAMASLGSATAGSVIGDPVGPGDIKIDCDHGDSINKALANSSQMSSNCQYSLDPCGTAL